MLEVQLSLKWRVDGNERFEKPHYGRRFPFEMNQTWIASTSSFWSSKTFLLSSPRRFSFFLINLKSQTAIESRRVVLPLRIHWTADNLLKKQKKVFESSFDENFEAFIFIHFARFSRLTVDWEKFFASQTFSAFQVERRRKVFRLKAENLPFPVGEDVKAMWSE